MTAIIQPNLASEKFQANPHEFWDLLRRQTPAYRAKLPGRRYAWLVTRYADSVAVLKDQRFIKDPVAAAGRGGKPPWIPGFLRPVARNMLDLDGSDHARLRRLVQRAFTARTVEALTSRIESIVMSCSTMQLRGAASTSLLRMRCHCPSR
jgi:cytochrome P450